MLLEDAAQVLRIGDELLGTEGRPLRHAALKWQTASAGIAFYDRLERLLR